MMFNQRSESSGKFLDTADHKVNELWADFEMKVQYSQGAIFEFKQSGVVIHEAQWISV